MIPTILILVLLDEELNGDEDEDGYDEDEDEE